MGVRNWFKKSSKTFDREGFYIILFICLCIVAVTAVYVSRNSSISSQKSAAGQKKIEQKEPKDKVDLVDEKIKTNTASAGNTAKNTEDKAVTTLNPPQKSSSTGTTVKTASAAAQTQKSTVQEFKISMPVEGSIQKDFDKKNPQYSKAMGHWETHEGIDIACDVDTQVKAVQTGKVVEIITEDNIPSGSEKFVFGKTVIIEHSNGMRSVYANLSDKLSDNVIVGKSVKKGQTIGVIGDTTVKESPGIEGSHLHFSLLKKSGKEYITVNPNDYLK